MPSVLVVEDYPGLQHLYQTALEAEGYEVQVAGDGETALEITRQHRPDLILLDLLMPKLGGLDVLRTLDLKHHPGIKVIVFSNMASPELAQEARELGALQYLIKTRYTPKEMVTMVRTALNPA